MNLNPPLAPLVPIESLAIETPFYVLERNGRVLRWNLASGDRQVLLDFGREDPPDFSILPSGNVLVISATGERREISAEEFLELDPPGPGNLTLSPDGRWFGHDGLSKDRNAWQFRIFEKATGNHRLYWEWEGLNRPASTLFSPDGRWIALCCTPEVAMISGYRIIVVDTETLALRAFAAPSPASAAAQHLDVFWSPAGGELLLYALGQAGDKDSDFFALDLSMSGCERIEGEVRKQSFRNLIVCFFRRGARVEFNYVDHLNHQVTQSSGVLDSPERRSPDGRWTARKQKSGELHNLVVLAADGALRSVHEQLPYEKLPPERVSGTNDTGIRIVGWLGRQHLLYYDRGSLNTYAYDAAADRAAVLFEGKQHPASYCW